MTNLKGSLHIDAFEMGHSSIDNEAAITYFKTSEDKKLKPWVCKITGIDAEYGFKREFCESKIYEIKNKKEWFKFVFKIEKGFAYEFRNFSVTFDESIFYKCSGFFAADKNGILTLTKNDVRRALGMRVKEDVPINPEEWKEKPKKKEEKQLDLMIDTEGCQYDKF